MGNSLNPKKDPRGLMPHDLDLLERTFKRKAHTPKSTIEEVMYQAGQQSVIDYIRNNIVAGR
jgi:hypothetical protein